MATAANLFMQNGFDNTSVSEIVKGAGMAQGTFYLYFDSKDSVLMALVEAFFGKLLGDAFASAAAISSPLARIEAAISTIVTSALSQKEFIGLLHSGAAAGIVNEPDKMAESWNLLVTPLAGWIREGIAAGEIREQDERMGAYFVVTLVHEVMERAIIMNYPGSAEEVMPDLQTFVRRALQA